MAAGLLWILDASINISTEPFHAFVADLLPESQRTAGFAMQSLFIGLGAVIASMLPWMLSGMTGTTRSAIPATVRLSFYIGSAVFLGSVLWTVATTQEYPPNEPPARSEGLREILAAIRKMPRTMKQLAWMQIATWLGLFCMWLYFP